MTDVDLSGPPFNLDAMGVAWVEATLKGLSLAERLHQLFVLRSGVDAAVFERIKDFRPGGITAVFTADPEHERRNIDEFIAASKVRPLISADLEGSRMSLPFG